MNCFSFSPFLSQEFRLIGIQCIAVISRLFLANIICETKARELDWQMPSINLHLVRRSCLNKSSPSLSFVGRWKTIRMMTMKTANREHSRQNFRHFRLTIRFHSTKPKENPERKCCCINCGGISGIGTVYFIHWFKIFVMYLSLQMALMIWHDIS